MQLTTCFLGSRLATRLVPETSVRASAPRQVTCMAKKKGVRCIVTLECTEARKEGGTPSRYTTQKSRRNTPGRLELMKYNKFLRRRTLHREIK
ncbi:hypothetical protein BSKO_12075 [Bryopsis sp. KO-2023]|nr:hypothetical protein BSKO_12075 [Bryopsis sp. KO-2023]